MRMIYFEMGSSRESLTPFHFEDIAEYMDEEFHGYSLPHLLIELLKRNNGGEPIQRYFKTQTNKYPIKIFYDVSGKGSILLHESTNIFENHIFYKDRFNSPYLLPIAETSFGDVVVLDYEGTPNDNPRVALWFHECDEHGVNSQPLEHIADDMASFLAMLTED
ncbi:hypothetical protein EA58_02940 [Photobacterium galatheae]|uniref:Knr4/Smi1-like domain-containing protein n=2 Tax=Photobacterium galatheae TaxID=1654360 RepID=A0A066RZU0_9GAMM|nr:hypothetical protein EA58_02940 [Photobacterium galatheae]